MTDNGDEEDDGRVKAGSCFSLVKVLCPIDNSDALPKMNKAMGIILKRELKNAIHPDTLMESHGYGSGCLNGKGIGSCANKTAVIIKTKTKIFVVFVFTLLSNFPH